MDQNETSVANPTTETIKTNGRLSGDHGNGDNDNQQPVNNGPVVTMANMDGDTDGCTSSIDEENNDNDSNRTISEISSSSDDETDRCTVMSFETYQNKKPNQTKAKKKFEVNHCDDPGIEQDYESLTIRVGDHNNLKRHTVSTIVDNHQNSHNKMQLDTAAPGLARNANINTNKPATTIVANGPASQNYQNSADLESPMTPTVTESELTKNNSVRSAANEDFFGNLRLNYGRVNSPGTDADRSTNDIANAGNESSNGSVYSNSHFPLEEEPFAILTKKENSCPFTERRISLAKQVKVGRSIGRTRPASDNAIFDCKVLSRHHALLWFQDGKFYLKDTCSSNGTFVNNQRLSPANEISLPQVLYSGDSIQFGVEVTEKKNVHSCVIANIRLFYPDGTEAKKDSSSARFRRLNSFEREQEELLNYANPMIAVSPIELFSLSTSVADAARKQAVLERQLESMSQVVKDAMNAAKNRWTCMVEEDRLFSRIETLQSQLEVCLIAKNRDDGQEDARIETLKEMNLNLIADKEKFEQETKVAIQQTLEEKIELETRLKACRSELETKIEECQILRDAVEHHVKEMTAMVQNCDKIRQEKEELSTKLKKIEEENEKFTTLLEQLKRDNESLSQNESRIKLKLKRLSDATPVPGTINKPSTQEQCSQTAIIPRCETHQQTEELVEMTAQASKEASAYHFSPESLEEIETSLQNYDKNAEQVWRRLKERLGQQVEKMDTIQSQVCRQISETRSRWRSLVEQLQTKEKNAAKLKQELSEKVAANEQLQCDIDTLKKTEQKWRQQNEKHHAVETEKAAQTENGRCDRCSVYVKRMLNRINLHRPEDSDQVAATGDGEDHEKLEQLIDERFTRAVEEFKETARQNEELRQEIQSLKERFRFLSYQNDVSFSMAMIPLFVIFVAIIISFYPFLSFLMATSGS